MINVDVLLFFISPCFSLTKDAILSMMVLLKVDVQSYVLLLSCYGGLGIRCDAGIGTGKAKERYGQNQRKIRSLRVKGRRQSTNADNVCINTVVVCTNAAVVCTNAAVVCKKALVLSNLLCGQRFGRFIYRQKRTGKSSQIYELSPPPQGLDGSKSEPCFRDGWISLNEQGLS